jgi:hypothetical protein
VVQHLPSKCKALSSNPSTTKQTKFPQKSLRHNFTKRRVHLEERVGGGVLPQNRKGWVEEVYQCQKQSAALQPAEVILKVYSLALQSKLPGGKVGHKSQPSAT